MKKHCRDCKHAGWDPDGNYCAAPKVLERMKYGQRISEFNRPKECMNHELFESKSDAT